MNSNSKNIKSTFHGGGYWEILHDNPGEILRLGKNIIPADVLDTWYPPAPRVLEVLHRYLDAMVHTSPPIQPHLLIREIARVREPNKQNIIFGGGSSQLIFTLLQLLLKPEDTIMLIDPMYGEYRHVAEQVVGCKVLPYLLNSANDFQLSIPDLASFVTKHKPRVVVMVNPNSPISTCIPKTKIQELLLTIPTGATVILDETYIEYAGGSESCESLVKDNNQLCILKSMSKIYALSGLRVGYLVAHESIITKLAASLPPWSVSLPAQLAAITALGETQYYTQKLEETKKLRHELESQLKTIPSLTVFPGIANFILCQVDKHVMTASSLIEKLQQQNIFIRNCDSMSTQFHDDYIRITIRSEAENERVVMAMKKILSS